jgi:CspA family cold shock protein
VSELRGVVKWWDDLRGIGFLSAEDGRDYFVHHTEIALSDQRRSLVQGEAVVFQAAESEKGPRARAVTPTGRAGAPAAPARPAPGEPWPPLDDPPDVGDA